ncbi:MAG: DUF1501 domain-containing protein [Blastocatellia bacterium]|nr:DUF1501 domain-containing protein [Blastocatellia bacterium]
MKERNERMRLQDDSLRMLTRRHFFRRGGVGIGAMALSTLLDREAFAQEAQRRIQHHAPRAKNVIFLFMAGGPSQLDMFDPKPLLNKYDNQPIPDELVKGERFAFIKGTPLCLGSPFKFKQHGQSGAVISELLPNLAKHADELAIIRSMHTTQFNHAPAQIFMNTGHQIIGRPSVGSWLMYGLGSENRDLPGFVVMLSGEADPDGGKALWGSGFLPTVHQGVEFRSKGDPVLFVSNPDGVNTASRRGTLDALRDLNGARRAQIGDPEIATRIEAYELAFRMQTSVPELTAIEREPAEVQALYGTEPGKKSFANNCLLARRLVERGVRFVQLYHRGWDTHGNSIGGDIAVKLPRLCTEIDRPISALLTDLKRRGLLDETLVVWGGEFGRTPMNEKRNGSNLMGRDHHPRAFTMWMAGAGVRAGTTLGKTDDFGYNITEDPVDVHDLHATLMHLMGIDHLRLTFRFQGRDFRLTDVFGNPVQKLLA